MAETEPRLLLKEEHMIHELRDGDVVMIGIDVNHEGDEMGRAIREALEQMTGVKLAGVIVVETLQGAFVFRGKRRST
jgi:hypothetical protein